MAWPSYLAEGENYDFRRASTRRKKISERAFTAFAKKLKWLTKQRDKLKSKYQRNLLDEVAQTMIEGNALLKTLHKELPLAKARLATKYSFIDPIGTEWIESDKVETIDEKWIERKARQFQKLKERDWRKMVSNAVKVNKELSEKHACTLELMFELEVRLAAAFLDLFTNDGGLILSYGVDKVIDSLAKIATKMPDWIIEEVTGIKGLSVVRPVMYFTDLFRATTHGYDDMLKTADGLNYYLETTVECCKAWNSGMKIYIAWVKSL